MSSKPRGENDKEEFYIKSETSNLEITISDKDEQSLSASTGTTRKGVNISSDYNPLARGIQETKANTTTYPGEATRPKYVHNSLAREAEVATDVLQPGNSDGITYVAANESNQTQDGIRHEFLNASRTSESSNVVTNPVERKKKDEVTNEKKKETGNKFARQEEPSSSAPSLRNAAVRSNTTKSSTNVRKSNELQEAIVSRNDSTAEMDSNIGVSTEESFAEELDESPKRLTDVIAETQNIATLKSVDLGIGDHTVESRTDQEDTWQSSEDDLMEAADFGLRAMHDLYYVQEPKLYSMGKH